MTIFFVAKLLVLGGPFLSLVKKDKELDASTTLPWLVLLEESLSHTLRVVVVIVVTVTVNACVTVIRVSRWILLRRGRVWGSEDNST